MKDINYRCDACKEILKGTAVGANLKGIVGSFLVKEKEYDSTSAVLLFCNWECHSSYMNEKFPIIREAE